MVFIFFERICTRTLQTRAFQNGRKNTAKVHMDICEAFVRSRRGKILKNYSEKLKASQTRTLHLRCR